MKRQLWTMAMAAITLAAVLPKPAHAAKRNDLCPPDPCSNVFQCDWSCTICSIPVEPPGQCQ